MIDHCKSGKSTSTNSPNTLTSLYQEEELVVRLWTTSSRRNWISRTRGWEIRWCNRPRGCYAQDRQTIRYAPPILGQVSWKDIVSIQIDHSNDYDIFMFSRISVFLNHHHHNHIHQLPYLSHVSNIPNSAFKIHHSPIAHPSIASHSFSVISFLLSYPMHFQPLCLWPCFHLYQVQHHRLSDERSSMSTNTIRSFIAGRHKMSMMRDCINMMMR